MVKNPPAMQETWVRSLDWEDSLEEGKATHSSILAWKIPLDRGDCSLCTVLGVTKSWATKHSTVWEMWSICPEERETGFLNSFLVPHQFTSVLTDFSLPSLWIFITPGSIFMSILPHLHPNENCLYTNINHIVGSYFCIDSWERLGFWIS